MKNMINVTSASDDYRFQCYFNNKGYCKFRDQCHYQHYNEACQKKVCRDFECPYRHPRTCRNGAKCKFLKQDKCAYKHCDEKKEINHEKNIFNEKVNYWESQIEILKAEIIDLKNSIENKTQQFEALIATEKEETEMVEAVVKDKNLEIDTFKKEIKVLIDENDVLKNEVKNLKAVKADLSNRIEQKDSLLEQVNSDFACDECDYVAGTLRELVVHIRSPHKTLNKRFFNCVDCKLTFKKEFDLSIHNSVKHQSKTNGLKYIKNWK